MWSWQWDEPTEMLPHWQRLQMKTWSKPLSLNLSLSPSVVCCRNERRGKRRSRGGKSGWTRSERRLWADWDPSERSGFLIVSAPPPPVVHLLLIKHQRLLLHSFVHLRIQNWLLTAQPPHERRFWWPSAVVVHLLCSVELSYSRALHGAWRTRALPERKYILHLCLGTERLTQQFFLDVKHLWQRCSGGRVLYSWTKNFMVLLCQVL